MVGIRYGGRGAMVTAFTDVSGLFHVDFLAFLVLLCYLSSRSLSHHPYGTQLMESAFTIAYLLRILHSVDPPLAANLAFDAIQRALPAMQEVGFDSELVGISSPTALGVDLVYQYEEFLSPLLQLVQSFAPEDPELPRSTEYSLIQSLQDPERSNCIVVVRPPVPRFGTLRN